MNQEGMGVVGLIGAGLLVVSYFVYPDAYHQFFQWLQEGFFDAVNNSFDGQGISEKNNKGGGGGK